MLARELFMGCLMHPNRPTFSGFSGWYANPIGLIVPTSEFGFLYVFNL
jgi:hypothetical protein